MNTTTNPSLNLMFDFILSDLQQRLARIIQIGTVAEVDASEAKVTVSIGDSPPTKLLPVIQHSAGEDVAYKMPSVGEQVVVLCPCGNMASGRVLAGINSTTITPGADDAEIHRMTYCDGTIIEYDKSTSTLMADVAGDALIAASGDVDVSSGGSVAVDAATQADVTAPIVNLTGTVNVNGPLNVNGPIAQVGGGTASFDGSMDVAGEVTANGVAVSTHTHPENGDVTGSPS